MLTSATKLRIDACRDSLIEMKDVIEREKCLGGWLMATPHAASQQQAINHITLAA